MLAASDPRVTLRVGGVMLALLFAAVAFAVFLLGHLELGAAVRVRVYFAHVAALKAGAPLVVASRVIGKIEDIALVPESRAPAGHPLHGTGGAVALVRIDEDAAWMVPINSEVFVSSRGALSDRYLEVGPPPGGAAPARAVRGGDALRGIDPPSLDRALQRTWDNLVRARLFFEAVRPEWDALIAELASLDATLDGIVAPGAYDRVADDVRAAAARASDAWDRALAAGLTPDAVGEVAARASETLDAIDRAGDQLRGRLAALRAGIDRVRGEIDRRGSAAVADLGRALDAAELALVKIDTVLAKTRALAEAFARGEGSIARLMKDPEFPEDAKDLGKVLKRNPWRVVGRPQDDDRDADSAERRPDQRAPAGPAPRR